MILNRIGQQSDGTLNIEDIFPRNRPSAFIDDSFYVEIYNTKHALKLQKELSSCVHAVI